MFILISKLSPKTIPRAPHDHPDLRCFAVFKKDRLDEVARNKKTHILLDLFAPWRNIIEVANIEIRVVSGYIIITDGG